MTGFPKPDRAAQYSSELGSKVAAAAGLVKDICMGAPRPAIAFGGGKDSMALLQLVRSAAASGNVPVVCLAPPIGYQALYYFTDKIIRMWGLERLYIGPHEAEPPANVASECGEPYPGVSRLMGLSAAKFGITHLFAGLRADEEGVRKDAGSIVECPGIKLVNPLLDFTESDVWEYVSASRLPLCTLYRGGVTKIGCMPAPLKTRTVPPARPFAGAEDDAEISERLKELGYM